MQEQQGVVVNRDMLKQVIDAIAADEDTAREFRWRGRNARGFVMTGDNPLVDLRCEEIGICITENGSWRADKMYHSRVFLYAIFDALENEKTVEETAKFLEEKLTIVTNAYLVALQVLGLSELKEPIAAGEHKIGMLAVLAKAHGLSINREIWGGKDNDPEKTTVVLVRANAPDSMKVAREAVRLGEQALDLVASTSLRARFDHGPPWEMRIGRFCWVWPEGETEAAEGMANSWSRGYSYEIEKSTLSEHDCSHFLAPPFPWMELPEGDMRVVVERAYISIGAAVRRAPDAHASITRAWTAIETLFAWGRPGDVPGDRAARSVANRFKVAAATNKSTTDPFDLVRFYFLRNDLVHDAALWNWNSREAMRNLSSLYRHVDRFAEFCLTKRLSTREALHDKLMEPTLVQETKNWIESWLETPRFRLQAAALKETRIRYGKTYDFFKKVLKACGP